MTDAVKVQIRSRDEFSGALKEILILYLFWIPAVFSYPLRWPCGTPCLLLSMDTIYLSYTHISSQFVLAVIFIIIFCARG